MRSHGSDAIVATDAATHSCSTTTYSTLEGTKHYIPYLFVLASLSYLFCHCLHIYYLGWNSRVVAGFQEHVLTGLKSGWVAIYIGPRAPDGKRHLRRRFDRGQDGAQTQQSPPPFSCGTRILTHCSSVVLPENSKWSLPPPWRAGSTTRKSGRSCGRLRGGTSTV